MMNSRALCRRRCSCAHDGGRGWLPCPFSAFLNDLNAAVVPAATPENLSSDQQAANSCSSPCRLPKLLLLLARDRFGRPLAGARVGMGALTANGQAAAMTQPAIAAEVHQTLDVHAGLAAKVALDEIIAVDHFTNLQHLLIAQ